MSPPVLRPYQNRVVAETREALRKHDHVLIVAPTGSGKCLGLGTPVLRYDGRIVAAETLCVGDRLMGPDSQPRTILSTTAGRGPMFRISPVKGDAWTCNDVHVLTLVNIIGGEMVDIPLNEYLGRSRTYKHTHKLISAGVDFEQRSDPLPIDPYFLGVWFGDGTKSLNGVAISKPDPEILALCQSMAERYGLRVRTDYASNGGCPTHHIVAEPGQPNALLRLLRRVVGPNVDIPHRYLVASRRAREMLLAGLLDTDGYLGNGCYEFVQKRHDYADAAMYLARSLGMKATASIKTVNGEHYKRVSLSGDFSDLPMRIQRKKAPPRRQIKNVLRTGFSVDPIGDGEYFGFEIDGDGRFLLGDFTITHNTVCAAEIIRLAEVAGRRIAFLAHRTELIDQTIDKLYQFGVVAGVIMANDRRRMALARTQVCSVPTLARRLKSVGTIDAMLRQGPPPADIVIYDECHHSMATTNRAVMDFYRTKYKAKIIGLTATPWRKDGVGLADVFTHEILACRPEDLIVSGALVDYDAFAFDAPDLHNVHMQGGDFNQRELGEAVASNATRAGNIVEEYLARARGRRAILFPVNVADSMALCAEFEAAGIRCAHIDWSTNKDVRRQALKDFDAGTVDVLSSVGVLTEGFDSPRAEVAMLARPTASLVLHLQMIGRVLRPVHCECGTQYVPKTAGCPKCGVVWEKDRAMILDFSGNLIRHGMPDDPERDYSSKTTAQKKKDMLTCPACKMVATSLKTESSLARSAAEKYVAREDKPSGYNAKQLGLDVGAVERAMVRKELGTLDTTIALFPPADIKARVCPNCGEILGAEDTTGMGGGPRGEIEEVEHHEVLDKDAIKERRESILDQKLRGHLTPEQMREADNAPAHVRRAEYARLIKLGDDKHYKANFASIRYRATFGEWPKWKRSEMGGTLPAPTPFFEDATAPIAAPPPEEPPGWWAEADDA